MSERERPAAVDSPYVAALIDWLARMQRKVWAEEQAKKDAA